MSTRNVSALAGPCEWCGGPQNWTIALGVMWVRCVNGCQSLFPEESVTLHPNSEETMQNLEGAGEGTILRMGGVPLEGGAAAEESNDDLPF